MILSHLELVRREIAELQVKQATADAKASLREKRKVKRKEAVQHK